MQEALLYLERSGDRVEVREWAGPGKVRTIRSLPVSVLDRSNIAVHGERLVWQQVRDNELDLMITEGRTGEPRRLATYSMISGNNEIAFSPDGLKLVLHYATPTDPLLDLIAIVDPSGRTELRTINTGLSYWYWPRWTPDNNAVLVVGGGAGAEAHVVSVPLQEGAKPVNLTAADPEAKWGFELSPDGRMVAYPHEIWKGSTVWKIDLGGAVATRQ